ncbi:GntR family transcriptional regulator [Polymorphum gilvum]|uniref:Putative GntR family transcriptional regulator n=1 Tax=Polymorphum gilvum (strain LMG 25793 / CGMCC 1.9160 / SL003B-26A1) TaxID=991905 RepID=F2IXI6_POLGS|nr:FCD domain-containing protein [Polymorphum gilvum]ADZ71609.1 Putative GntR family transcriptional regulator [Polymorphum gilvum SL003B-26A1]
MIDATHGETVGDNAYRAIRNDIIFGRLKPSERLRLEPLRKRYNVSVTTLREILNRLTSDGFVIAEGQKGFEVAPVSDDDLKEIADLRILIESHALRRSFEQGDLDWEAQVVAAYHKLHVLERRMMAGETEAREDWKRCDWEFHRALISGCGSRFLLDTHGAVFDKYLRYQMLTLTFRGEKAAREHKLLLDAALTHDAETAADVLREHILGGVEHSLKYRGREAI